MVKETETNYRTVAETTEYVLCDRCNSRIDEDAESTIAINPRPDIRLSNLGKQVDTIKAAKRTSGWRRGRELDEFDAETKLMADGTQEFCPACVERAFDVEPTEDGLAYDGTVEYYIDRTDRRWSFKFLAVVALTTATINLFAILLFPDTAMIATFLVMYGLLLLFTGVLLDSWT